MTTEGVLDIVAVGLGPANLGLAAAVDELDGDGAEIGAVFLDRRPAFDWHPDMQGNEVVEQEAVQREVAEGVVGRRSRIGKPRPLSACASRRFWKALQSCS